MKHYITPLNGVLPSGWYRLFFLTLLITATSFRSIGQINAYAKVTGISGTTLSLSDVNQTYHTFISGEQIIIMQMQDNVIGSNTSNTSSFGMISGIANAGKFEIVTINSAAGLPTSLTITAATSNTYNFGTGSSVQIISFRKYGSPNYITTANITGLPWNGKVGGVIAMQVPGTFTIAHSINADGLGFRGGNNSNAYESTCEPLVYASSSANYAYKGEGIQVNNTGFTTGRAPIASGGGGGSDDNGGGAGGSNYSDGGIGGYGWTCSASPSGGVGGKSLSSYISGSRVFMGGGGGGGQQNNNVGSAGANGGGIILIKANSLTTSCSGSLKISANGLTAANSGNDGAGGGGAGGSVVFAVNNYSVPASCPLSVEGNGGTGGNVTDGGAHGGGGGGGQGVVIYATPMTIPNINTSVNNGAAGTDNNTGTTSASSGSTFNNTGIMGNQASTLPVKLANFSAQLKASAVVLTWNTLTEQNNDHFNVQRSINGLDFTTIGVVKGAGNSNSILSYTFTDPSSKPGRMVYRLQQVDKDGAAVYSTSAVIIIDAVTTGMSIYPNPVRDQFTIQVPATIKNECLVSVIDLSGKAVLNIQAIAVNGKLQISTGDKLITGIYAVRVSNPQGLLFSKIIVE